MFIDNKKFTQLREASRNGDLKASEILKAFRDGGENVTGMLEEYFAPKVEEPKIEVKNEPEEDREEMSRLEKFLADNDVTPDSPDYDEYVEEFNSMFPEEKVETSEKTVEEPVNEDIEEENPENVAFDMKDLIDDESEAIEGYDKKILEVTNLNIDQTLKLGIIAELTQIKNEEIRHLNSLQELGKKLVQSNNIEEEQE